MPDPMKRETETEMPKLEKDDKYEYSGKGRKGKKMLTGGAGDDVLIGTKKTRVMMGGAGSDTFVFSGRKNVVVKDFNVQEGDKLSLVNESFEVLSFRQVGNHTMVEKAGRKVALLQGVEASSITAESFVSSPATVLKMEGESRKKPRGGDRKRDDDKLTGYKGKAMLVGGTGDDTLVATNKTRVMMGGTGSDTFVISGRKSVVIKDFDVQAGDKLSLSNGMGFEDLTFRQVGNQTMVQSAGRKVALLQGVDAMSITANSFVTPSTVTSPPMTQPTPMPM
jgi:Ca2+-binding RTX toxin-like protein